MLLLFLLDSSFIGLSFQAVNSTVSEMKKLAWNIFLLLPNNNLLVGEMVQYLGEATGKIVMTVGLYKKLEISRMSAVLIIWKEVNCNLILPWSH